MGQLRLEKRLAMEAQTLGENFRAEAFTAEARRPPPRLVLGRSLPRRQRHEQEHSQEWLRHDGTRGLRKVDGYI